MTERWVVEYIELIEFDEGGLAMIANRMARTREITLEEAREIFGDEETADRNLGAAAGPAGVAG